MKRILTLLLLALTISYGASAQEKESKKNDKLPDRKEMLNKRATRMASQLKIDEKTQAWFIPLYVEYQDTLQALSRPERPAEKGKKQTSLSDEEVLAKIEKTFADEETRTAIRRAYYARFKEKLTPQQLLSIFSESDRMPFRPMQGRGGNRGGNRNFEGGAPGGFGGGEGFGGEF